MSILETNNELDVPIELGDIHCILQVSHVLLNSGQRLRYLVTMTTNETGIIFLKALYQGLDQALDGKGAFWCKFMKLFYNVLYAQYFPIIKRATWLF